MGTLLENTPGTFPEHETCFSASLLNPDLDALTQRQYLISVAVFACLEIGYAYKMNHMKNES